MAIDILKTVIFRKIFEFCNISNDIKCFYINLVYLGNYASYLIVVSKYALYCKMNAEFGFNAKNYPHSHVFSKKILTPTKVVTLEFGRGS